MRILRWLAFLSLLAYQQYLLHVERQRLAHLSEAIDRHFANVHRNKVWVLPSCNVPLRVDPPDFDASTLDTPQEN